MQITQPTAPLGNKARRTRQAILDAAKASLVAQNGHLEIATVAQQAKVSPGLIYRYFRSRIDLIAAVVDAFYDDYDQQVMTIQPLPEANWLTRERERVSQCLDFIAREPLCKFVLLNQQKDPLVAAVENNRLNAHLDLAIKNVKQAQRKGEIPHSIDAPTACAMTMGAMRQVMVQILNGRIKLNRNKTLDQVMCYIAAGMGLTPQGNTADASRTTD
jgi:AcrR family transcriptional regulator